MELDMYAENLIYNYEHPLNKRKLDRANARMHEENISCGDRIDIFIEIKEGKAKEVTFEGSGCVISMGAASILTESLKGMSLAEIEGIDRAALLRLINIDPGPVRMHCATLSLRAVKKAVFAFEKKPVDTATKEL
ncbi:MAG: iron-sulfur cluster assembly scaffold protein [Candidatus Marsarchaeota archaeon]|jgi:nitrogen fixation NifU-like protein|nr:iron-sulfur cluster assembly scaffold protein [Candidatus Marsarchaeota archaeon]